MNRITYRTALACLVGSTLLCTACQGAQSQFGLFAKKKGEDAREIAKKQDHVSSTDKEEVAQSSEVITSSNWHQFNNHETLKLYLVGASCLQEEGMENSAGFADKACSAALLYTKEEVSLAAQEYLKLFPYKGRNARTKWVEGILKTMVETGEGKKFNILGAFFSLGMHKKDTKGGAKEATKLFRRGIEMVSAIQEQNTKVNRSNVRIELAKVAIMLNHELGDLHSALSDHKQAHHHYVQAMAIYTHSEQYLTSTKLQTAGKTSLIRQLRTKLANTQVALRLDKEIEKHYFKSVKQLDAGNAGNAIEGFQRVIQIIKENNLTHHPIIPSCQVLLGGALLSSEKYESAKKHIALENCVSISQICSENEMGDLKERYSQKALDYATAYDDTNTCHAAKGYLLRFSEDLANHPTSMKGFLRPFVLDHTQQKQFNILGVHHYLGVLKLEEEALEEAIEIFKNGQKILLATKKMAEEKGLQRTDLQYFEVIINYQLGLAHHKLKDYKQAIQYYSQALTTYKPLQKDKRITTLDTFKIDYVSGKMQEAQAVLQQRGIACEYMNQAKDYYKKQDYKNVIKLYNKACIIYRTYGPQDLLDSTQELLKANLRILTRLLELKIQALTAWTTGDKCMRNHQYEEAKKHYRVALSIYEKDLKAEKAVTDRISDNITEATELTVKQTPSSGRKWDF